jgi:hypothetical protein
MAVLRSLVVTPFGSMPSTAERINTVVAVIEPTAAGVIEPTVAGVIEPTVAKICKWSAR